ncbi:hypothetical protein ILUMI_12256 [Ignelater luminosus]|uniref:Uncharacterized protein n=1 Tax=Ignelater luminosus TaxID=2038154 RepID=A0A8K0CZW7_IGNLU|nr:hypothetical protein ILUMI_12256 [Ignelater luminosus]
MSTKTLKILKLAVNALEEPTGPEYRLRQIMWDESQAGRGGAFGLVKWAKQVLSNSNAENLIIWSDNCSSQNRNLMMAVNYFHLLNICPSLKQVDHKLFLRGHAHIEADHIHALIERTVKKQPTMTIATSWDWSPGARVLSMEVDNFKNFTGLYSDSSAPFTNR